MTTVAPEKNQNSLPPSEDELAEHTADWEGMGQQGSEVPQDEELAKDLAEDLIEGSTPG